MRKHVHSHTEENACYGIIVAAGSGRRFGGLKQFSLLGRKPLIFYSLAAFERARPVKGVVIAVNLGKIEYVNSLIKKLGFKKVKAVVTGGATRAASVSSGLSHLPLLGYVAVHDAARPFITARMLERGFYYCRRHGPVTYGHPVTDALKLVSGNKILKSIDRNGIYAIQTPQFFPISLLRRAYHSAVELDAPDDCYLVEKLGIKPLLLPSHWSNFKITTRHDLTIARRLV